MYSHTDKFADGKRVTFLLLQFYALALNRHHLSKAAIAKMKNLSIGPEQSPRFTQV